MKGVLTKRNKEELPMPHCAGLHLELEQALPTSIDRRFNGANAIK